MRESEMLEICELIQAECDPSKPHTPHKPLIILNNFLTNKFDTRAKLGRGARQLVDAMFNLDNSVKRLSGSTCQISPHAYNTLVASLKEYKRFA